MIELATNVLYYGDNLDILRRYLPDAAVDLVYLDPPFATDAYLLAFEDTLTMAACRIDHRPRTG